MINDCAAKGNSDRKADRQWSFPEPEWQPAHADETLQFSAGRDTRLKQKNILRKKTSGFRPINIIGSHTERGTYIRTVDQLGHIDTIRLHDRPCDKSGFARDAETGIPKPT